MGLRKTGWDRVAELRGSIEAAKRAPSFDGFKAYRIAEMEAELVGLSTYLALKPVEPPKPKEE